MREIRLQINAARSSGNTVLYTQLIEKNSEMNKEIISFSHGFIEEYSDSDFALMLLEQMIGGTDQELERFSKSIAILENVINRNSKNKNIGKKVQDFVNVLESQKNLDIGKIAPNFTSTTPDGKELSLNDIKGKVTIIEFWAAWCGPCRRENPNIVKVYNKYHKKGLEIIGVSLDGTGRQKDSKAAWLKAIEDDKLIWHQVSSLQYFDDPVAKLYNINSIPASFILDEDGKIVAKRLRGQALEDQIAKMLD
jgi:peroxiredoxin